MHEAIGVGQEEVPIERTAPLSHAQLNRVCVARESKASEVIRMLKVTDARWSAPERHRRTRRDSG